MIRALLLAAGIGAMMAMYIPNTHKQLITRNYVIDAQTEELVGTPPAGAQMHYAD